MKQLKYICSIFLLFASELLMASPIKIVLRYDDPQLQTDTVNDSLFAVLQRNDIPFSIAVIPCDSAENLICDTAWQYFPALKKAVTNGKIEIALHGLVHKRGEFGNIPYEEQYRRIFKGKYLLDSVLNCNIITFVPPYNTYDKNTLIALEQCGFKVLSSYLENRTIDNGAVTDFPCTIDSPVDLLPTVDNNHNREGVIVLMFHQYNFTDKFTVVDFEKILLRIKENLNVEFITFANLINSGETVNNKRIEANRQSNLLSKQLKLKGMLHPVSYCNAVRWVNAGLYSFASLAISLILYLLLMRRNVDKRFWLLISFMTIVCFAIVYFHCLSPMRLVAAVVLLSIGNTFVYWLLKRK